MRKARTKSSGLSRRTFLGAMASGAAATVARPRPAQAQHSPAPGFSTSAEEAEVVHPYDSPIMRGFPPSDDNLVTHANYMQSHEKCRWALQHMRELYPTQTVSRGDGPIWQLPRGEQIRDLKYRDSTGKKTSLRQHMEEHDTDGFLIMRRGEIVFEEYFHGMTPKTHHMLFSLIKSIEATVIGALVGNGVLERDGVVDSYVPELKGKAYEGATIQQLLDMESGIRFGYGLEAESEFSRYLESVGPAAREFNVPVGDYNFLPTLVKERDHGERLGYKESDRIALVWAAEKATGVRFADLLSQRIWSKIGAEHDAEIQCDPLGHWGFHLAVTLRDLARWGQMCLHDGALNGRPIITPDFFDDIRKNATIDRLQGCPMAGNFFPKGLGYRSFFYRMEEHDNAIGGAGAMGQCCYVSPKYDTVIAFFSSACPWAASVAMGRSLDEITDESSRLERERWNTCLEISRAVGAPS